MSWQRRIADCGHTLVINGKVFKLKLLPSGIVRGDKISIIGNGVVIDPWALLEEIEEIKKIDEYISISPAKKPVVEHILVQGDKGYEGQFKGNV